MNTLIKTHRITFRTTDKELKKKINSSARSRKPKVSKNAEMEKALILYYKYEDMITEEERKANAPAKTK